MLSNSFQLLGKLMWHTIQCSLVDTELNSLVRYPFAEIFIWTIIIQILNHFLGWGCCGSRVRGGWVRVRLLDLIFTTREDSLCQVLGTTIMSLSHSALAVHVYVHGRGTYHLHEYHDRWSYSCHYRNASLISGNIFVTKERKKKEKKFLEITTRKN